MPPNLSFGEEQKVAIARALINNPCILLADEPTGNLDSNLTEKVLEIFKNTNKKFNQTIIMITHNLDLTKYASRIIKLEDGKIVKEIK
jgi:putative ABC transport system ATP-binding protein